MERLAKRWSLRDFGTLQFLWDSFSGEYIQIHGPEAVRDDGPWRLDVSNGSAELVSCEGEGQDVVRFDPAELAALRVRVSEDGEIMVCDNREVGQSQFSPLHSWLDDNKCKQEHKALVLPVQGYEPFKCVFTWEAVPCYCGDKPVCLWADFKWLLSYVFGKKTVSHAWRYAGYLSALLEKIGLSETHVDDSARSQANKRRRTIEGASPIEGENVGSPTEWRVSMLAAIVFLEHAAFSKNWSKSPHLEHKDSEARAEALLSAFLEWPRHGETDIAFALEQTRCQLLLNGMVVDH